jgi:hypothetical protein
MAFPLRWCSVTDDNRGPAVYQVHHAPEPGSRRTGSCSPGTGPIRRNRQFQILTLDPVGRGGYTPAPHRWGRSSVGRAPEWHSGGQGFDSPRLHQSPSSEAGVLNADHPTTGMLPQRRQQSFGCLQIGRIQALHELLEDRQ